MNFKPLNDQVLIKREEAETKTAGGLFIPDSAKEKPRKGVVVAVGPGRLGDKGVRLPMEVAPGDTVIYSRYAGTEIKVEGEEHVILKESDILVKAL
ncbi:MAG: co-chaperone GroES [Deltaproteobacteria bacterium]|nr:co-chaperone GroES [Deltaproteobacteria bacterium]